MFFRAPAFRVKPSTASPAAVNLKPKASRCVRKRTHPPSSLINSLSWDQAAAAAAAAAAKAIVASSSPSIQPPWGSPPTSTTTFNQPWAASVTEPWSRSQSIPTPKRIQPTSTITYSQSLIEEAAAATAAAAPAPTPPLPQPNSQPIAYSIQMPSSSTGVAREANTFTGIYDQPEMNIPNQNNYRTVAITTTSNTVPQTASMSIDGSAKQHSCKKKAKIDGTFRVIKVKQPHAGNGHYNHKPSSGLVTIPVRERAKINLEEERRRIEEMNMQMPFQVFQNEQQQEHQQEQIPPQEPPVIGDPNVHPVVLLEGAAPTEGDFKWIQDGIHQMANQMCEDMVAEGSSDGVAEIKRCCEWIQASLLQQYTEQQEVERRKQQERLERLAIDGQQQYEQYEQGDFQAMLEPQGQVELAEPSIHEVPTNPPASYIIPTTSMQASQLQPQPKPPTIERASASWSTSAAKSVRVALPKAKATHKVKATPKPKATPQLKTKPKAKAQPNSSKASKSKPTQSVTGQPETELNNPTGPFTNLVANANGHDPFCWICHNVIGKQASVQHCTNCSLSFHADCAKKEKVFVKNAAVYKPTPRSLKKKHSMERAAAAVLNGWNVKELPLMKSDEVICRDCIQKEAGLKYNKVYGFKSEKHAATNHLIGKTFNYACVMLASKFEEYSKIDFTQFGHFILQPLNLETMATKALEDYYQSTEAFMYDIKLVIHNLIITLESDQPDVSSNCTLLYKFARDEANSIDNCDSCFRNFYEMNETGVDDSHVMPCQYPHALVWMWLNRKWRPAKAFEYRQEGTFEMDNDRVAVMPFGGLCQFPIIVLVSSLYLYSKNPPPDHKVYKIAKPITQVDQEQNAQASLGLDKYLEYMRYYYEPAYAVSDEPQRFTRDDIYMSDIRQKDYGEDGRPIWEDRQILWDLEA